MIRRDFLKFLGTGLASLPFAGKLLKESGPEIKAVAKNVARTLPKVKGMPEWFNPLVSKIMKEGVDISPKASRLEDMEIIKKLEIHSKTGKPETITLTQNKTTGEITIESKTGGVADSPFEVTYKPPKSDINLETGQQIKDPGDFYVIENRPKPDYNNPGKVEFDYDTFHIDNAHSDIEKLEKIATRKIKDVEKAEQRLKNKQRTESHPYEDIMDRYPDPEYAEGGIASFAKGGRVRYENGGVGLPPVETNSMNPAGFSFDVSGSGRSINPRLNYTEDNYGGSLSAIVDPFNRENPRTYSGNIYFGPEDQRYTLGINTTPRADAKDVRAGYESKYGNISFGASKDPMNKNVMLNYSNSFADGGNVVSKIKANDPNAAPLMNNLASGLAIQLGRPVQPGDPIGSYYNGPTTPNMFSGYPNNKMRIGSFERNQQNLNNRTSPFWKNFFGQGNPSTMPNSGTGLFSMFNRFIKGLNANPAATSSAMTDLTPDQINALSQKDRLNRSLNLAGFGADDINRILASRGYADGGYVNTNLTRTIPPVRGPNPQGVETLFKRRYS